jgi:16S rRNA (cytosine967-C5)-methyltransferase
MVHSPSAPASRAPSDGFGASRAIAARALVRVWSEDAFAAAVIDAELRREAPIDPRDAALATELVYGVLRTEAWLEERIDAFSSRRPNALDPAPRAHLLMGAYALAFLDRIPAFAAVSAAVEGVSQSSDRRVGGFANAVLRRIAESVEASRPIQSEAIAASAPGWLRGALRRSLGRASAPSYLAAGPVPPPTGICLSPREDRAAWIDRLRSAAPNASIEMGETSPHAVLLRGGGDARRLPGCETSWIVQEEGSQLVALALGARPGERVLDACSGRGNKAFLLSHAVGPEGAVDAADLYPGKLEVLRQRGIVRDTYTVDWSRDASSVPDGYDRALVDAPCSGIGTLRRRPEIARKRTAEDVTRLSALQSTLVRSVAGRVRHGGTLVYAVCSVLLEEAEQVVERITEPGPPGLPSLELSAFEGEPARSLAGQAATLRLLPHVHGTDGYFLASFRVLR